MQTNDSSLLPLVLSAKMSSWRMDDPEAERADRGFEEVKKRVKERDNYTCKFCTFRAGRWQEVHHVDDNHANNGMKNLVTACNFCHMCFHVGLVGTKGEAKLAWMPEISQAELNHVIRSKLVAQAWLGKPQAREGDNPVIARNLGETIKMVNDSLNERVGLIVNAFGSANPAHLGNALIAVHTDSPKLYEQRERLLGGLRLVMLGKCGRGPDNVDRMPEMIDSWMDAITPPFAGPYAGMMPSNWHVIMRTYVGRSKGTV